MPTGSKGTPEEKRRFALASEANFEAPLGDVSTGSAALQQRLDTLARDSGIAPAVAEGLTDPDAVPQPPDAATTRPGDLVGHGPHRLLCGDSTTARFELRASGIVVEAKEQIKERLGRSPDRADARRTDSPDTYRKRARNALHLRDIRAEM